MFEKLKEYWNKYKKYVVISILAILGIFVLNFLFVITDWIAGKGFNWKAIIYSPISNEEWLSFIGVFVGGFATFLLFLSAKETLQNEKGKARCENEIKNLEKKKKIIEEYLKVFEINDIYDIKSQTLTSSFYETIKNDEKIKMETLLKRSRIIKKMNLVQLKLDLNTNFRIKLRGRFKAEKYENEMNKIYHELVDLRNMYGIVLENISTEIIDLIKVKDLNKRERKINSINKMKLNQYVNFRYNFALTYKIKKSTIDLSILHNNKRIYFNNSDLVSIKNSTFRISFTQQLNVSTRHNNKVMRFLGM